jgi:hypothetical protein
MGDNIKEASLKGLLCRQPRRGVPVGPGKVHPSPAVVCGPLEGYEGNR